MTRYWAVCNVDDSITFATALLEQPAAFQELVIVHELIHLLVRDHGPYFRMLLRLCLPACEQTARLAPGSPAQWVQRNGVREARGAYRTAPRLRSTTPCYKLALPRLQPGESWNLWSRT